MTVFRTYDYTCKCGHETFDEIVEVILDGNEVPAIVDVVLCGKCGEVMHKKIPTSNVHFGHGFFAGMGNRRVEVITTDTDGKEHVKNITHRCPTDTSFSKE